MKHLLIFSFFFLIFEVSFSQVELVNVSNPIYDYLKRMQLMKIIPDYNSSIIPLSRGEIAKYLITIKKKLNKLTSTDIKLFEDYVVEFEYDMYQSVNDQYSILSKQSLGNIFSNKKQKHFYFYNDSNATLFTGVHGFLSQRGSRGDSLKSNSILLGEFGAGVRGSLFNSVGYFLELSNGQILNGDDSDIAFAAETDPFLRGNNKFINEKKNFDAFEGYIRYQTKTNWLSLTIGRTPLNLGFGYIDRLFLSNNTVPFDFAGINIEYKAVQYLFFYGSLNGDSAQINPLGLGRPLSSKNIASHRLNIKFSKSFSLGLWEAVIISQRPFSFTYFNPISFLTSADLSTGKEQSRENNSLLGVDFELLPFKNFSFQSSLLIDDLTFGTLFKTDSLNENKFGWQFGVLWTNYLNMDFAVEFTHLDPFVYSHRSNKSTYTNWSLSLGHALPPNSDEIAARLSYNISNRLRLDLRYQHQRSGEGIVVDSIGNIIANYGGNINFGLGDAYLRTNGFLDGIRINRDIFTVNISWQPVKQFFFETKYQYRIINNITDNINFKDSYYWATIRVDL